MKNIWIIFFVCLGCNCSLGADLPPVSIVLDKNYSKTLTIRLNGEFVPNKGVLEKLSQMMTNKERPVVVLMPGKVSFDGRDEIRGLLDKIGYLNVRYFVYSDATQRMTELDLPHLAVPFSMVPGPKGSDESKDKY